MAKKKAVKKTKKAPKKGKMKKGKNVCEFC